MDRRKFMSYTAIGAVLWATGVTLLGNALGSVDFIANNLEAIAVLIVLISVLPMVVEYLRARGRRRDARYDEPHERQAVLDDDVHG